MKTEPLGQSETETETLAQPCNVCGMKFDADTIAKYDQFETAYIQRLEDTSKDYLADLELVYQEAGRVFTQHHVMYELDTMLSEAYKEHGLWNEAATHLQKRIDFATSVRSGIRTRDCCEHSFPCYVLFSVCMLLYVATCQMSTIYDIVIAGMYEELGDLLTKYAEQNTVAEAAGYYKNSAARAYETAFNGLIVLMGADHEYTLSAHVRFAPRS